MFESKSPNPMVEGVEDVTVQEVKAKMAKLHLLDIRRPDEWESELKALDEAQKLEMDTIDEHIDEIPKEKPIVVICRSGQRSARVSSFLKNNGFNEVYNMAGGMIAWYEE